MNYDVRPTETALSDAASIGRYIANQGFPGNAERWFTELMEVLRALSDFPHRCPLAPESADLDRFEIRHRIFGNYRILFTIHEHRVFVLHIRWGGRRAAAPDELLSALDQMEAMKTFPDTPRGRDDGNTGC